MEVLFVCCSRYERVPAALCHVYPSYLSPLDLSPSPSCFPRPRAQAVCALTLCPGGSSSVVVGESELDSVSRRALEAVTAAPPRRWPARRRLLVFEAIAFAIPTGQGMTGSQQAAAMFNKMALLVGIGCASSRIASFGRSISTFVDCLFRNPDLSTVRTPNTFPVRFEW